MGGYHWEVGGTRKAGMRMNMLNVYENRRMKPAESVLRIGGRREDIL
jgi:hypothetical protein